MLTYTSGHTLLSIVLANNSFVSLVQSNRKYKTAVVKEPFKGMLYPSDSDFHYPL
ncbi:hypothetical protein [Pontibacter vulgaris]|uniref:hypothetical protein n=1 Tax=Pontibacter vulgaris TaxID=2905679 RepID=UPI001FA80E75|nr:hypothetical protein [Pontibacter vulgaris]